MRAPHLKAAAALVVLALCVAGIANVALAAVGGMGVGSLMSPTNGAASAPPAVTFDILTEGSSPLITESSNNLVTESAP